MNWNECGHALINQSQRLIPSQSLAKINETLKPFDTCILQIHTQKCLTKSKCKKLTIKSSCNKVTCLIYAPKEVLQLYSISFHGQNIKCGPNGPCLCEETFKIVSQMFDKTFYATLIEMNVVMPLWINHKCSNHHNH